MTDHVAPPREKMFNVPPVTLALVFAVVAAHVFRVIEPYPIERLIINRYAFLPAAFWHNPVPHLYTLVTYAFLHGGWLHLAVNATGLLAFGSAAERAFGRMRMGIILLIGTVAGVLGHAALFYNSDVGLIGISAGVSALFGAVLLLINRGKSMVSVIVVFIAVNAAIGTVGMPNEPDMAIAWQAHVAGFLSGLASAWLFLRKPRL